MIINMVHW